MTSSVRTVNLPQPRPTAKVARGVLLRLAHNLHGGQLVITEGGRQLTLGDSKGPLHATIEVHSKTSGHGCSGEVASVSRRATSPVTGRALTRWRSFACSRSTSTN